ncbi:biorientation of chromosomes in cell division protein 1-like 1 isoform X2 [Patella vulgata]|uniref:biorientation of chromosomes in cell division protein 1-like 1 isoform X2 n=1 Tax=Patella vulgata TaxID=6465 RepID=UPI0021807146|nr:biorientation of chromosomes in cell division protein 1-like 1 isoform X2 [Patella vulgata]
MESVPLEMDDIFGDGEEEDNYPGPLADLPEELEPTQNTDSLQNAENDEVLSKLKDLSKGAAKNTVRRPIPKLDSKRLTGERGIPIVPKLFENVKFKGKGHEHDLKLVMDKLEHWSHRLFPKLPFDEVLARVEKLGAKKEVQTCIKKMRQDMPILDEDFVGGGDEAEEEEEEETTTNDKPTSTNNNNQTVTDMDAEDVFDEIMRQEASQRASQQKPAEPTVSPVKTQTMLSDEQKERIERNKRIALEKRLARLGQTPNKNGNTSSQVPTTLEASNVSSQPSNLIEAASTEEEENQSGPSKPYQDINGDQEDKDENKTKSQDSVNNTGGEFLADDQENVHLKTNTTTASQVKDNSPETVGKDEISKVDSCNTTASQVKDNSPETVEKDEVAKVDSRSTTVNPVKDNSFETVNQDKLAKADSLNTTACPVKDNSSETVDKDEHAKVDSQNTETESSDNSASQIDNKDEQVLENLSENKVGKKLQDSTVCDKNSPVQNNIDDVIEMSSEVCLGKNNESKVHEESQDSTVCDENIFPLKNKVDDDVEMGSEVCEGKNDDVAMDTDEQQKAEEILKDLDDL